MKLKFTFFTGDIHMVRATLYFADGKQKYIKNITKIPGQIRKRKEWKVIKQLSILLSFKWLHFFLWQTVCVCAEFLWHYILSFWYFLLWKVHLLLLSGCPIPDCPCREGEGAGAVVGAFGEPYIFLQILSNSNACKAAGMLKSSTGRVLVSYLGVWKDSKLLECGSRKYADANN